MFRFSSMPLFLPTGNTSAAALGRWYSLGNPISKYIAINYLNQLLKTIFYIIDYRLSWSAAELSMIRLARFSSSCTQKRWTTTTVCTSSSSLRTLLRRQWTTASSSWRVRRRTITLTSSRPLTNTVFRDLWYKYFFVIVDTCRISSSVFHLQEAFKVCAQLNPL